MHHWNYVEKNTGPPGSRVQTVALLAGDWVQYNNARRMHKNCWVATLVY